MKGKLQALCFAGETPSAELRTAIGPENLERVKAAKGAWVDVRDDKGQAHVLRWKTE